MSNIGITQPGILLPQALPVSAQPAPVALPILPGDSGAQGTILPQTVDVQGAEQTRVETLQKAAQQIANVFVLGDQSFSLFKDATGQYITRFTSLRDGKVTYIPEPSIFKLLGSSTEPSLSLKV